MRMGQQMKLAPRMIQAMEVLQMSQAALEERIEQELAGNAALELVEPGADARELRELREQAQRDDSEGERELVVGGVGGEKSGKGEAGETAQGGEDFERLGNLSEEYGDTWDTGGAGDNYAPSRRVSSSGERDAKMDAMANTAARGASLFEQLMDQWRLLDLDGTTLVAGEHILAHLDADGYLRTPLDELLPTAPEGVKRDDLERALATVRHTLEPAGLGARDLRECLLLQIDAVWDVGEGRGGEGISRNGVDDRYQTANRRVDLSLEREIVDEYLKDVEANRLPKVAKEFGIEVEEVKRAILNLRQFHPHPGRLLADEPPRRIIPDATVEYDDEADEYVVSVTDGRVPALRVSPGLRRMADDPGADRDTRKFLADNIRSARWLLDALRQRASTLQRVVAVTVEHQREFFEQGPQALRPLPMTQVAEQLGVHVATISRAVSDKYIQTPRGIFPLRMFYSGGTQTQGGESMSWAAVQAKLQEIIDAEDKAKPLSDDALVEELKRAGIEIARRTVAKYRSQMNIPTARQRREYV